MPVISFVNMKGGVAKTTLAVNVADFLARRNNEKVLLIDLDPQFNATQCLVNPEEYVKKLAANEHTIYTIFDDNPPAVIDPVSGNKAQKPVELKTIKPWKISPNLDLIPGNLELYRLDVTGQGRELLLRRYLEESEAHKHYAYILIDTPPTPSNWMMSALLASECYVIPVRPDPLSRTGIDLLWGVVNRCTRNFGHKIECLGVVLTMVESGTVVLRDSIEFLDNNAKWKGKRFPSLFSKKTMIAREQAQQKLIYDINNPEMNLEMANIVRELQERLKPLKQTA